LGLDVERGRKAQRAPGVIGRTRAQGMIHNARPQAACAKLGRKQMHQGDGIASAGKRYEDGGIARPCRQALDRQPIEHGVTLGGAIGGA
jgi:hypothetical protein